MKPLDYFAGQALHALLRTLPKERPEIAGLPRVAALVAVELAGALCQVHRHDWESDQGNGTDGGQTCARCELHQSAAEMCAELGHDWGQFPDIAPGERQRQRGAADPLRVTHYCQRCGADEKNAGGTDHG